MVLQHIQSQQTKQNVTSESDKTPSPTAYRCRGGNSSKSVARSKERATNLNVRDVNLDDVKSMEPKWRAKKYEKITMVKDDQQSSSDFADGNVVPRERKLTLQDFIAPEVGDHLSATQAHKQIGMTTSEYIVVAKERKPSQKKTDMIELIDEEECEASATEKTGAEVAYSEVLEDDFVLINVH